MIDQNKRPVLEGPDGDEVMIGEVQVNEEVENPWSEVSATEFDDWQQKEYAEVTNKEVIKRRWVLKPQGKGVKARFVMKPFHTWKTKTMISSQEHQLQCRSIWFWLLAAKRVALGKSQTMRVWMFPLRFFLRRSKMKSTSSWMQTPFV